MVTVSRKALEDAIDTVDFPADKETIVAHAEQADAPVDVQRALRSLPPVDYRSAAEVIRSVHADVGSAPTAAQRADPEFGSHTPGVADRLH